MSDTLYDHGNLVVGRFWGGPDVGDCIQITLKDDYVVLTLAEFRELVRVVEENVEATKNAWWHEL